MKRVVMFLCAVVALQGQAVFASELRVSQSSVDAEGIYLFTNANLKDEPTEISVGQVKIPVEDVERLEEHTENIIFLIDLSTSVTSALQTQIREILTEVMWTRRANQQFMLLGFGETTEVLCELTADPIHIQYTLDRLDFSKKASNIYDALNETVKIASALEQNQLHQVIIVTDGILYTDYGVTQNELFLTASKLGFEIQTIGLSKGNNDSDLNELFALSRITEGVSFSTKTASTQEIGVQIVERNDDISQYRIPMSRDWADGSEKAVTLVAAGETLVRDIRIPTILLEQMEPEPEPEPEPVPEPEPEPVPLPEPEPEPEPATPINPMYVVGVVSVLGGCTGIFLLVKKRKEQKQRELDRANARYRPPSGNEGTDLLHNGLTEMLQQETVGSKARIMQKNNHNFSYALKGETVVGRGSAADWVVESEKSISSRHCKITEEHGAFYIEDLGSTNKTFLNGTVLTGKARLTTGDVIKMGRMEFLFEE